MRRHKTFETYGEPIWKAKFAMWKRDLQPLKEALTSLKEVEWNVYHTSTWAYDKLMEQAQLLIDIAIYQKKFEFRERQMLSIRIDQLFNLFQKLVLGIHPPSTKGFGPWRPFTVYIPIFWSFYTSLYIKPECLDDVSLDLSRWNRWSAKNKKWSKPARYISKELEMQLKGWKKMSFGKFLSKK